MCTGCARLPALVGALLCNGGALVHARTRLHITPRTSVQVVTGFLGSGKTTLINHILSQPHGRKVAVIENEFGEVGIDNDLIVGKEDLAGEGELTILENGCLCCTVRDDLVKALDTLVKRGGFDHVLVETTGARRAASHARRARAVLPRAARCRAAPPCRAPRCFTSLVA